MSKGYKQEYIDKVKFHDLQPINKTNKGSVAKPCADKVNKDRPAERVVVKR
jgi:hypothetical protein